MVERQYPQQARPLSNSEVIKLIRQEYAKKTNDADAAAMGGAMAFMGNEHGHELRKQTVDYIELFNEFEVDEQDKDIRKYLHELSKTEDVSEHDCVLLWNLMPENYEQAVALVPELQKANVEKIVQYIDFLKEKRGPKKH